MQTPVASGTINHQHQDKGQVGETCDKGKQVPVVSHVATSVDTHIN